ncbi:MAG: FadR/GntR family transcriptional regulator [Labrys sp. (in: a-proteobacteria)]
MAGKIKSLGRAPALHQSVQAALKQFILDNDLRTGDPLPPEATLARQLGVGRNSVREAIKALESLGFLETRRGIGVFVGAFTLEPLMEQLPFSMSGSLHDLRDVLELRQALEVSLIEKVVGRIDEENLAELRAIVAAMGAKAQAAQSFSEEDRAFHKSLFRSLGNTLLMNLIDTFWTVFHHASGRAQLGTTDPVATWRDHAAIVEAVANHDLAAAREKLDRHYADIATRIASNGPLS